MNSETSLNVSQIPWTTVLKFLLTIGVIISRVYPSKIYVICLLHGDCPICLQILHTSLCLTSLKYSQESRSVQVHLELELERKHTTGEYTVTLWVIEEDGEL
ncbi:hypothetical protein AAZX31_04G048500 [Glycine max]